MARRVKIKQRKPSGAREVSGLRLVDFAHPSDLREKTTAFIVGFGGPAGIVLLLYVMPKRDFTAPLALAWTVLAFLAHFWFRPWQELRSIRKNPANSAEDVAFGNVVGMMLDRIERLYPGASGVRAMVVSSGAEPVAVGRTILVPAGLRGKMSESEMLALLAHHVGHVAAGHARWLNMVRSVNLLPQLFYWLSLPVLPLAQMLRRWSSYADATADRFAALVAGEGKLVAQAILRLALTLEPAEQRISAEEISAHLARTEGLKAEESEIVTHFRLGEYLKERPDLYARLRQVVAYANSQAFKTAQAKLRPASQAQSASG